MTETNRGERIMAELKFEITEHIATLSTNAKGWATELNLISWNNRDPKLDIRSWDPDHGKMGKGITLTPDEAKELLSGLQKLMID